MARKVWVEMSRVLGFATDWFRSNVRVILQYSANDDSVATCGLLETFMTRKMLGSFSEV